MTELAFEPRIMAILPCNSSAVAKKSHGAGAANGLFLKLIARSYVHFAYLWRQWRNKI